MSREDIKPGMAFRSVYVEGDIFLFAFASSIIKGDGLYRRFNRVGGFVETDWYRFQQNANHLQRVEEFDFVG
ncbi:MAG: hypothetical protein KC643_15920 [Nitrospira sp.]|nr:hypothetical protein [Nitrospira sp.]